MLSLAGNPLSSLPDELVRANAKDLCSFLRLYDNGSDVALQARLMLLGEENVCNCVRCVCSCACRNACARGSAPSCAPMWRFRLVSCCSASRTHVSVSAHVFACVRACGKAYARVHACVDVRARWSVMIQRDESIARSNVCFLYLY